MNSLVLDALRKANFKDIFFGARENKKLFELRLLPSYGRLKNKYEKFPTDKGVDNFGFTIGDILDVADLYNHYHDIDIKHSLENIKIIARDFTAGKTTITDFEKKLNELNPNIKLESDDPIRNLPIDIEAILIRNDKEMGINEITHYPGGINLERFVDISDEKGYCILFSSKHNADNTSVSKIFQETGIPMRL